jgi:hypothetical protein
MNWIDILLVLGSFPVMIFKKMSDVIAEAPFAPDAESPDKGGQKRNDRDSRVCKDQNDYQTITGNRKSYSGTDLSLRCVHLFCMTNTDSHTSTLTLIYRVLKLVIKP